MLFSSLATPVLSEVALFGTSHTYVPKIQSFSTKSSILSVADESPQDDATSSSPLVSASDFSLSCPEDDDDGG